ncbi:MAG: hypothetical protein ACFWUE_07980 [Xylanivirga thermophila]
MDKSMEDVPLYKDTTKDFEERVEDLVKHLSLEEKVSQLVYNASAISSLGIPEYNWWNECIHGVARAGVATVFPQAIGMAASFNQDLAYKVAVAIPDEGRAKYHEFTRQGDHSKYLKIVATSKHYAVHSGPESLRHEFNARVNKKDMYETYLPAFKEVVKEGKAYSITGVYNRTNDEPYCASPTLLQKNLRDDLGVGRCLLEPGQFRVYVGGQQPDKRSEVLTGKKVLSCEFEVKGGILEMEY